ncbi:hypothetical protein AB1N83_014000 [Pleurotus pulmonarius]
MAAQEGALSRKVYDHAWAPRDARNSLLDTGYTRSRAILVHRRVVSIMLQYPVSCSAIVYGLPPLPNADASNRTMKNTNTETHEHSEI